MPLFESIDEVANGKRYRSDLVLKNRHDRLSFNFSHDSFRVRSFSLALSGIRDYSNYARK